jgi:hypothetical protein
LLRDTAASVRAGSTALPDRKAPMILLRAALARRGGVDVVVAKIAGPEVAARVHRLRSFVHRDVK